eukprot:UN07308
MYVRFHKRVLYFFILNQGIIKKNISRDLNINKKRKHFNVLTGITNMQTIYS